MDDFVHYFVKDMPVYDHEKEIKNGYRFILATLVNNKFCSIKEPSEALGVSKKNVERYAGDLKEVCQALNKSFCNDKISIKLNYQPLIFTTASD